MIGYLIQRELQTSCRRSGGGPLLTMIVVDPDDPAFARPASSSARSTRKDAADAAAKKGWAFRQDESGWRRVVPSPEPRRIVEIRRSAGCWSGGRSHLCGRRGHPHDASVVGSSAGGR
jgi:carbamate kinase